MIPGQHDPVFMMPLLKGRSWNSWINQSFFFQCIHRIHNCRFEGLESNYQQFLLLSLIKSENKMSALVIKVDSKSNKIIKELAKKLGGIVLSIDDNQYEDIALGYLMDKEKTGKTVSRDEIMKRLKW